MQKSSKWLMAAGAALAAGGTLGIILGRENRRKSRSEMYDKGYSVFDRKSAKFGREKLQMIRSKIEKRKARLEKLLQKIDNRLVADNTTN